MWRLVVLIGVFAIALGLAAATDSDPDAATSAGTPARRADIVCEPGATQVKTARVAAQRDGVHLVVDNRSSATLLEIRSATDSPLAEVPLAVDVPTEATFPLPPGPASITCSVDGVDDGVTDVGVLTVVDPKERWVSPDLACDEAALERAEHVAGLVPTERASSTARRAVPGLLGTDDLEAPGYPGSDWHGDLLVVIREGTTIARIARADDKGEWHVFVEACPGSGLAEG